MQEQKKELEDIMCKLAAMAGTVREAFVRRKAPPGDLVNRLNGIIEEIAFSAVQEEEAFFGQPLRQKKPLLIYQSILAHLHIMTTTMVGLVEEIQRQVREGISFPEPDIVQANVLFTQHEMILCTMEEAVRSEDPVHLRAVCDASTNMIRLCRRSAAEHERCVTRGLCLPDKAIRFLTILDLMRLLAHHGRETVKLVVRWQRPSHRAKPA